jgi:predicted acyl esterase
MIFEKDVAIEMNDGTVLRANVFRPDGAGQFPVIMAQGVYGKDTHFADAFKVQFEKLTAIYPDLCKNGSTGQYLRWETVDPERWVAHGYVVIQVDSRGTGASPGFLDPRGPREIRDYYLCIEWAGQQSWSNGKVGLIGISYYAFTQWAVAALQPPHLAAIAPWEGFVDYYRDSTHHGGILANTFTSAWWPRQVLVNQHGNAKTHYRDRDTEAPPTGPALSEERLAGNRVLYFDEIRRHRFDDAWFGDRAPDLTRIKIPVLSAGNWGGPGVHLRGNVEGYMGVASKQKWLSMHIGTHWDSFYLPDYVTIQRRFFDHFLKGEANGWDKEQPVQLAIRKVDGTSDHRAEAEFPIARTRYTPFHLDADAKSLSIDAPASDSRITYDALGDGVDFSTKPFAEDTEITGFVTAKLFVSSTTADMDIFATLRLFDPAGKEVIFTGAHEPTPVARGWLRDSHRRLDPESTLPYRVFHAHDEAEPLTPGQIYQVDVEIWPTCVLIPKGYRLVLTVSGKDCEVPGIPDRILHNDPQDRDPTVFGGRNTIATGHKHDSHLVLPVIPAK